jgi:hypothetical protein
MPDRLAELIPLLKSGRCFHELDDHIKRFLRHNGFIKDPSAVHSDYLNKNTEMITFVSHIHGNENSFRSDIIIMVKPDHSERRKIRVVIQMNGRMYSEEEDEDRPGADTRNVFFHEIKDAEKFIDKTFRQAA